jgi:hypothetical protein
MNTPFLGGASAPLDAFQRGSMSPRPCILTLGRQWEEMTRLIDDDAAYKAAERAAPPSGGDAWFARIWDEREAIEAQIAANAEPTVEAIAVKLRMMAWHMRYMDGGLHGEHPPSKDENTITSALAAAERIAAQGDGRPLPV